MAGIVGFYIYFWMGVMVKEARRKWIMRGIAIVALFVAVLVYCVRAMLGYPADVSTESPSGRYIIQNVPVERIFMLGGMAYLRITDKQDPGVVFRSPLYDMQSLDMHTFENEKRVGIYWISFDREKKAFTISMPEWKESLLNVFVSNTPYTHLEND